LSRQPTLLPTRQLRLILRGSGVRPVIHWQTQRFAVGAVWYRTAHVVARRGTGGSTSETARRRWSDMGLTPGYPKILDVHPEDILENRQRTADILENRQRTAGRLSEVDQMPSHPRAHRTPKAGWSLLLRSNNRTTRR